MRARTIGAVALVGAALAAIASTASGAPPRPTASPSGSRSTRRRRLGADRQGRQRRSSRSEHPGVDRQRPVPDLGQPPAEVRRHARRRERTRRHRDGQHRDDEVHGGRRVPGPHVRQGVVRRTRAPGSTGLAASGRYGGKLYGVPYYAGSRVVTYRTDLFKKAGHQGADEPRAVHGRRQEARPRRTRRRASRPSTSRAPTGTSR